jgi:hypothetical protein
MDKDQKPSSNECYTPSSESFRVQNSDCVISSDSVDREITESSEVQQLQVELYRVHGRTTSEDVIVILQMAVIRRL